MNKLKEAVRSRSRSRHRASKSLDSDPGYENRGDNGPRRSMEAGALSTPERGGTNIGVDDATARMRWLEIHGDEEDEGSKALPPLPTNATERIAEASDNDGSPTSGHIVPPRKSSMARKPLPTPLERRTNPTTSMSSRQGPTDSEGLAGHHTTKSLDLEPNDPSTLTPTLRDDVRSSHRADEPSLTSDQILGSIPGYQRRAHSPQRDRVGGTSAAQTTSAPTAATSSQPLSDSSVPPTANKSLPIRSSNRDVPSTRNEKHSTPTSSRKQNVPVEIPEHVRLPEGFSLGNSTTTHVDTSWDRAVTHHTVHHQRTEQVHQPIERHYHVDHHYHYVQPILVQEILPPKHFAIDEKTGQKVEIPAPEGWVLPAEMRAQTEAKQREIRELEANLGPTTRHYVVDEEHPRGQMETASQRHQEEEIGRLRKTTSPRS